MSCQLIALWTGVPVARSHSTVVSRWFVMPEPDEVGRPQVGGRERGRDDVLDVAPDLDRVVLDVPGPGEICRCSTWLTETTRPARSKIRQRDEAVPWSTEAM